MSLGVFDLKRIKVTPIAGLELTIGDIVYPAPQADGPNQYIVGVANSAGVDLSQPLGMVLSAPVKANNPFSTEPVYEVGLFGFIIDAYISTVPSKTAVQRVNFTNGARAQAAIDAGLPEVVNAAAGGGVVLKTMDNLPTAASGPIKVYIPIVSIIGSATSVPAPPQTPAASPVEPEAESPSKQSSSLKTDEGDTIKW